MSDLDLRTLEHEVDPKYRLHALRAGISLTPMPGDFLEIGDMLDYTGRSISSRWMSQDCPVRVLYMAKHPWKLTPGYSYICIPMIPLIGINIVSRNRATKVVSISGYTEQDCLTFLEDFHAEAKRRRREKKTD